MLSLTLCSITTLLFALQIASSCLTQLNLNEVSCTTSQCNAIAAGILNDMKRDIDPCEDFHAYACGGFLESRRKTPDIDDGSFEILQESVDQAIESIVTNPSPAANDTVGQNNFLKLSGLWLSCMDVSQIKLKRKTILSVVQKNLELFPVFNSSFGSCPYAVEPNNLTAPLAGASQRIDGRALARTLANHNKMGLGSIISLSVGVYRNDPVLQIFGEGPFFSTAFYGNDTNVRSLEEEVTSALMKAVHGELFHASILLHEVPASCLLDDVARDAVDFEKQLAEIGLNGRDSSMTKFYSHKQAIGKLSALTPSIDWALALGQILPDGTNRTVSITLPSSKTLQDLERLLQSTSPKKLQNFMIWLVIRQVSTLFRHEEWSSPQRRRKHCVNVVNWCLGHMAGHYFVQQSLERGSLNIVKDMAMDIQKGLQENLFNSTMLNGSTAAEAIRKTASVLIDVGYATKLQSSESLQQFYKDYDVDPSDYFGNLLRSRAQIKARSYESLKHQVRNLEQYVLPQSLGAFYYMHMGANRIYIPAGVIQHPRFHAQGPEYINFGTIGYTLGHELVHGLTGQDRFFNSSALKSNWWNNASSIAYAERAQCFIDQYNGFTVIDSNGTTYSVNGTRTLTENISDHAGLKLAFRAWQSRYRSDPYGSRYKNFRLPGLEDLTPEKLFFISHARLYCETRGPSSLKKQIEDDWHSPAFWRVNGAVQNSVDFAIAFNCPRNATMNPLRKCDMW